jgi:DDE superfamily endonuclease
VFIDETWVKTNMAPLRGWGARGERQIGKAPYGRWRTLTFVAALRCDGLTAPCVFDGPINAAKFLAYVEQILMPTLRSDDIVILDTLGSHKSTAVRAAIRSQALLPAALQPRPQPDRAGLLQAQTLSASRPRTHHRRHLAADRRSPRPVPSRRMQQLPRQRRLRFRLTRSRSSYPHLAPGWLLDGDIHHRPLDLRLRPVLQAGLAPADLLKGNLAALLVQLLKPIKAVAAVAIILQAWLTLPSCFASSKRPALARMIFCSLVISWSPSPPVGGPRSQSRCEPHPAHLVRSRKTNTHR